MLTAATALIDHKGVVVVQKDKESFVRNGYWTLCGTSSRLPSARTSVSLMFVTRQYSNHHLVTELLSWLASVLAHRRCALISRKPGAQGSVLLVPTADVDPAERVRHDLLRCPAQAAVAVPAVTHPSMPCIDLRPQQPPHQLSCEDWERDGKQLQTLDAERVGRVRDCVRRLPSGSKRPARRACPR